ncbi:uncharacterized protein LOC107639049 [Arachis ipaensis]|uniref:uncharacterized protein LOC107639049 n=1 Tax=Arachis ipaensis TaxID=130454 RepID=UPI000A2B0533|nr:uncharacterized protein LOC107639049 [Arachis ipaensis]
MKILTPTLAQFPQFHDIDSRSAFFSLAIVVFFTALLASRSALLVSCASSRIVFCSAPPCSIFSSRHSETFALLRRGVVHIFLSSLSARLASPFKYDWDEK